MRSAVNSSQSINLYRAIVQRRVLQCGYAESKSNVLRPILNVLGLTDGAVRQFSGSSKVSEQQQNKMLSYRRQTALQGAL